MLKHSRGTGFFEIYLTKIKPLRNLTLLLEVTETPYITKIYQTHLIFTSYFSSLKYTQRFRSDLNKYPKIFKMHVRFLIWWHFSSKILSKSLVNLIMPLNQMVYRKLLVKAIGASQFIITNLIKCVNDWSFLI